MPKLTDVLHLLDDIEGDVYAAYGRAMAQAQDFEITLAVYVFGRRGLADRALVADSDAWLTRVQSGHQEAHVEYGLKLVRMTAGQRARELELPSSITDEVAAIVATRNLLAHHWWRQYAEARRRPGAREEALAELAEAAIGFRRRAFGFLGLLGAVAANRGILGDEEAERVWVRYTSGEMVSDES